MKVCTFIATGRCTYIIDIEHAVLSRRVVRLERDDLRGNKYVIEGVATDGLTPVGVVGRFASGDRYLIITVYQITEA